MTATACSRVSDFDGRPCWPVGVSTRAATLRATRSLASACRMARLSARWPMVTARTGVPGGHRGQRLPHVGGGQLAKLPGADDLQDRLQHVLVLCDRLGQAALKPSRQPAQRGLAYGVVRITKGPKIARLPPVWSATCVAESACRYGAHGGSLCGRAGYVAGSVGRLGRQAVPAVLVMDRHGERVPCCRSMGPAGLLQRCRVWITGRAPGRRRAGSSRSARFLVRDHRPGRGRS